MARLQIISTSSNEKWEQREEQSGNQIRKRGMLTYGNLVIVK